MKSIWNCSFVHLSSHFSLSGIIFNFILTWHPLFAALNVTPFTINFCNNNRAQDLVLMIRSSRVEYSRGQIFWWAIRALVSKLLCWWKKIKSFWWSCSVKPKNKTCLYDYGLQLLVMFILFAWAAVQLSIYYPWDQQLDPAGRFTVCWTRPTLCPRARSDSFTLLCGLAKNSSSCWTRSSTQGYIYWRESKNVSPRPILKFE